jgi:hypothetical protein
MNRSLFGLIILLDNQIIYHNREKGGLQTQVQRIIVKWILGRIICIRFLQYAHELFPLLGIILLITVANLVVIYSSIWN